MLQMINLNKLLLVVPSGIFPLAVARHVPETLFLFSCESLTFVSLYLFMSKSRWFHIVHAVLLFILCSPSQGYRLRIVPLRSIDKKRLTRHLYHSKYMHLVSDQFSSIWYFLYLST